MTTENDIPIKKDWKYYLGLTLFIYSFLPYIVSGLIFFFKVPIADVIGLIGIFLGSAELAFIVSVILLGKPFIHALKVKVKGFFIRHKEAYPAQPISKRQHRLGVALLLISFLPWFLIEIALFFDYPTTENEHMIVLGIMLFADALFIVSLFILGDDFWERLKNLFCRP